MKIHSFPLLTPTSGSGFALHPLLVHFPIALLLVGSVAMLWQLFLQWRIPQPTTEDSDSSASTFSQTLDIFGSGALTLGYAGLILTIGAGLADLLGSPRDLAREGWIPIAIIHLSAGFGLMVLYGILLYRHFFNYAPTPTLSNSTRFDWTTLAIVVAGIILVIVTGWFGGELVYSYHVGIS